MNTAKQIARDIIDAMKEFGEIRMVEKSISEEMIAEYIRAARLAERESCLERIMRVLRRYGIPRSGRIAGAIERAIYREKL